MHEPISALRGYAHGCAHGHACVSERTAVTLIFLLKQHSISCNVACAAISFKVIRDVASIELEIS